MPATLYDHPLLGSGFEKLGPWASIPVPQDEKSYHPCCCCVCSTGDKSASCRAGSSAWVRVQQDRTGQLRSAAKGVPIGPVHDNFTLHRRRAALSDLGIRPGLRSLPGDIDSLPMYVHVACYKEGKRAFARQVVQACNESPGVGSIQLSPGQVVMLGSPVLTRSQGHAARDRCKELQTEAVDPHHRCWIRK
jgi:hypothetical protein